MAQYDDPAVGAHMSDRSFAQQYPDRREQTFDIREALAFAWRHWKFISTAVLIAVVIGGVLLHLQPSLYTASSQILLDQPKIKPPGDQTNSLSDNVDITFVETQMAIIRSTALLRRVVEANHLERDPEFAVAKKPSPVPQILRDYWSSAKSLVSELIPTTSSSLPTTSSSASIDLPNSETEAAHANPPQTADSLPANELPIISALKGSINVTHAEGAGNVLTLSVTASHPAEAARLANAVAETYIADKSDARFEAASRASAWLHDHLDTLQAQLHDSEEAVAEFKAKHGLIQSGQGGTLTQQQLGELNANLVTAKADLAQKKAQVDLLNSINARGGSLQDVASITNGGNLLALRHEESTLSIQKAELLTRYDASHPLVVNVDAQLQQVQRSIAAETARLAAAIRNDYASAQTRLVSLEASLRQATGQTNTDDATAISLRELERTAGVNQMLFEDFLKQAKITQANASFEPQDARIITPAVAPGLPSSPNRASFMGEAIILGLLGGLGGSFLKEKLRRGFVTPRELEGQIGLPVLASIQRLGNRDLRIGRKISRIYELPFSKPGDRYSESIRSLRSSLQIMVADDRPRVIQVTSATPGEGKTTISLSMAVSAAATLKVLLIDADLRRSSATHAFKLEQAPGLVDVLLGEIAVPDALQYSEQLKHWMLPAGKRITNSVDLLGSEKMKQLLLDLKRDFDLIIVDTPPSGLVIDPVVVSHICDKILYVVRWGTTPRELVKQSVNVLSSEHHKIGGITLNMVDEKKARKYGRNSDPYYYASRHHKNYYAR